MILVFVCGRCG